MAHFEIPVNLPHAATIAKRIEARLEKLGTAAHPDSEELMADVRSLIERLGSYEGGDDPPDEEAGPAARDAAGIARRIVDGIERLEAGEDRLGQIVRNLFECLGLGEEGAAISLRAGENPDSLMRPV